MSQLNDAKARVANRAALVFIVLKFNWRFPQADANPMLLSIGAARV
jgi:hypothetical protein